MQNDKFKKYNHLIYRIFGSISTHASGLSSKRLRGYVFAGVMISAGVSAVTSLGKRLRRDDATSVFAIT